MRMNNTREMSEYLEKSAVPKEMRKDVEFLENRQQIEEFMFLGLRKRAGISEREFKERFRVGLKDIYGKVIVFRKKNFTVPLDGNSKMCMDRP